MMEHEWLACPDPDALLDHLRSSGRASERKLRLFAVGCCRRVWHLMNDGRSRKAVAVVERWVDGEASRQQLEAAHAAAGQAWRTPAGTAAWDASTVEWRVEAAAAAASHAAWAGSADRSRADERRAQADLLRCIVGNPFRVPAPFPPAVLAWQDGTVVKLARSIYQARRFEDVPVLADALEEAGCSDADVLGHLRGPGPHGRGCWVVDALLGKG
jgi:hypothetical protein